MKRYNNKIRALHSKHTNVIANYIFLSFNYLAKPFVRLFSVSSIKRGDPIGFTVLAFINPYPPSVSLNIFADAFITLMGMAATLFFVTVSLPEFFTQDPSYALVIQRLDSIFLLYERFLLFEYNAITVFNSCLSNLSPEILRSLYFILQEHVTVRESIFSVLVDIINTPEIQFTNRVTIDRVDSILEDFRSGGNNLVILIRNIEDRLGIPEGERIPTF